MKVSQFFTSILKEAPADADRQPSAHDAPV
jgi:hypothetical protein